MPEANGEVIAGARRYVTFRSGTDNYALPAEEVAEIISMPSVARLPHSPAALLGVANLRGSVIAVASLRGLLGQAAGPPTERAILLGGASPVAISVDHVDTLISLNAEQVETRQVQLATNFGERLRGAFQRAPDAGLTKILDIQTLLDAAFTQIAGSKRKVGTARQRLAESEHAAKTIHMLVSFEVCGQEYALPLQNVQEIVPLPDSIALVPRGEALLLGVTNLRGIMLPLLSLRGLLGFPLVETQPSEAKIIVTLVAGVPAGLVADRAKAIISAPADKVQPAPAILVARMGGEARIGSIYRDNAGRIVSILAVENMFGEEVMARLSRVSEQSVPPRAMENASSPIRQFLVFRVGEEEFGLPIAVVDEVAAAPEKITRLPKTPKFLEGLINFHGQVLPVINQRRRFDMLDDASMRTRLLVVRTLRHRAGLLVDGISGVVSAPEDDIEPAPHVTGENISMVNGVLSLEAASRIILLLNPDELLSRTERGLLENFVKQQQAGD